MSKEKTIKDVLSILHGVLAPIRVLRSPNYAEVFIFCYHRINTSKKNPLGVDADVFARQISLFRKEGEVLSPEGFLRFVSGEDPVLPRRKNFLITFDDGYVSTVEAAMPILQKEGARALSFIATGYLGMPSPYSVDQGKFKRERILTEREVRETQETFLYQSHGHLHLNYHTSTKENVLEDIRASSNWFTMKLGYRPTAIAYPFGLSPSWSGWRDDLAREGIQRGFVTGSHSFKVQRELPDLLNIPRVGYLTDETVFHTRARLTGGLEVLRFIDQPWVRNLKTALISRRKL